MRYYKLIENDRILSIGTGYGGEEITEAEYNAMLFEIRQKASFVSDIYVGNKTIDDVPDEWQEEIQRRVNDRIAIEAEAAEEEISG